MRFRTIAATLIAVVLSTVVVPIAVSTPAVAQSQTDWYVNDDPTLFGPSNAWYSGAPGHGYGSNNYRYTYAIGGESTADNWVHWYMGNRVGRQEIQVYIPSNHATATVNYNITIGGNTYKRAVAQRHISGWHSLGNWTVNGADVVLAVYDNDAEQHLSRNGYVWSSIGIDAVRDPMRVQLRLILASAASASSASAASASTAATASSAASSTAATAASSTAAAAAASTPAAASASSSAAAISAASIVIR